MTRLGFLWSRTMRDEAALQRLSAPLEVAMADLAGLHVALVGNARSLAAGSAGPEIDAADLVIRLNAAPIPSRASHGTRTDWMAIAVSASAKVLANRAPRRVLWMSTKLRRLPWRVASSPGFVLRDVARNRRLDGQLEAPATTGLLTIDLLAGSPLARATLFGFDFFASNSLSGRRTAADVPHDFSAERAWVEALLAADPRFELHSASVFVRPGAASQLGKADA